MSLSHSRRFTRGKMSILVRCGAAALVVTVLAISLRDIAPAQEHMDKRAMLSYDEVTSATLALEELEASIAPGKDGAITFNLLRATQLYSDPPPIYPEALAGLDGKMVKITGFMTPYDSLDDMTRFMLMPSPSGCFFCQAPNMREVVLIRQDTSGSPKYNERPIEVSGKLKLWTKDSDDPGHQYFLYVMDMATVKTVEL